MGGYFGQGQGVQPDVYYNSGDGAGEHAPLFRDLAPTPAQQARFECRPTGDFGAVVNPITGYKDPILGCADAILESLAKGQAFDSSPIIREI